MNHQNLDKGGDDDVYRPQSIQKRTVWQVADKILHPLPSNSEMRRILRESIRERRKTSYGGDWRDRLTEIAERTMEKSQIAEVMMLSPSKFASNEAQDRDFDTEAMAESDRELLNRLLSAIVDTERRPEVMESDRELQRPLLPFIRTHPYMKLPFGERLRCELKHVGICCADCDSGSIKKLYEITEQQICGIEAIIRSSLERIMGETPKYRVSQNVRDELRSLLC